VTTITAPVYGFYAGNDARIGATVPATVEAMKAAGKKYEPVTYDGAGHGSCGPARIPATPSRQQDRSRARILAPRRSAEGDEECAMASNSIPDQTPANQSAISPVCHEVSKPTEAAKL